MIATVEKPGTYYFDGINYIFFTEADGNSRMICEVRGAGDGKYEENAKLLVNALNATTIDTSKVSASEMVERIERVLKEDDVSDECVMGDIRFILQGGNPT